jgi:hypothetical protein
MFHKWKVVGLLCWLFLTTSTLLVSDVQHTWAKTLLPVEQRLFMKLVRHYEGNVEAVAVGNKTAYFSDGPSLIALDITNPALPTEIGRAQQIVTDTINSIVTDEKYVYLAARYAGFSIIDFSSPSTPKEIGHLYGGNSTEWMGNLSVVTETVYLTAYGDSIKVVDIKDPKTLMELAVYPSDNASYLASILAVKDHYMVSSWGENLDLIDVSSHTSPFHLADIDTGWGYPMDIEIGDGVLYSVNKPWNWYPGVVLDGGLYIIDISDVNHPQQLASMSYDYLQAIDLSDKYVFMLGGDRLYLVDIREPRNPTQIDYFILPIVSACSDLEVSGNYIYLACGEQGLSIYQWKIVEMTNSVFLPIVSR